MFGYSFNAVCFIDIDLASLVDPHPLMQDRLQTRFGIQKWLVGLSRLCFRRQSLRFHIPKTIPCGAHKRCVASRNHLLGSSRKKEQTHQHIHTDTHTHARTHAHTPTHTPTRTHAYICMPNKRWLTLDTEHRESTHTHTHTHTPCNVYTCMHTSDDPLCTHNVVSQYERNNHRRARSGSLSTSTGKLLD